VSVGIKCRECGYVNTLGRVFCSKCGKKLDLSRVSTRLLARSTLTPADRRARLFRWVVVLVLAAVIGLMLWPMEPEGVVGSRDDVKALRVKVGRLERAAAARAYVFDVVTEEEVNAFLEETVGGDPSVAKSEGLRLGIETIRVRFTPEQLKVFLLANWGPLKLSYMVAGVPEIRQRRFSVNPTHGRLGHLWLPAPLAGWIGGRISYALSGLERERRLLDQLGRCELGDEKVRLLTRQK
jgi:hypothetical protein